MTISMQQAIARLQQIPEDQQDVIARLVLHEIEEDERWMETTAAHSDKLGKLVNQIAQADSRGELQPLDPDQL